MNEDLHYQRLQISYESLNIGLQRKDITYIQKLDLIYFFLDSYTNIYLQHAFPEIACEKGCSHCCSIDVQLTGLEAFYIAQYKDIEMDNESKLTIDHTSKCPFLCDDQSCGIYDVRPFICRSFLTTGPPEKCLKSMFRKNHPDLPDKYENYMIDALQKWLISVNLSNRSPIKDIRDFFPSL